MNSDIYAIVEVGHGDDGYPVYNSIISAYFDINDALKHYKEITKNFDSYYKDEYGIIKIKVYGNYQNNVIEKYIRYNFPNMVDVDKMHERGLI